MSAKTGDKAKAPQKKLIGKCGHVIKPVRVWRSMKRWCDTCDGYAEQVKK